jgi:DNA-binding NtrC family response regulator
MMISPFMDRLERRESILLAAPDPAALAPLRAELSRRGADVSCTTEIDATAEALDRQAFDAVYVAGRDSADATLMLMRLLQGRTRGARLMLVVEAMNAGRHAQALALADEVMTFALSPARMADAAGVGFHREAAFA